MAIRARVNVLSQVFILGLAVVFSPIEVEAQSRSKAGAVTNRRGPSRSAPSSSRANRPAPAPRQPTRPSASPNRGGSRNNPGRNVTPPSRSPSQVFSPNRPGSVTTSTPRTVYPTRNGSPRVQSVPTPPRPSSVFQPHRYGDQSSVSGGQSGSAVAPGFVRNPIGFNSNSRTPRLPQNSTPSRMGAIGRAGDFPRRNANGANSQTLTFNDLDPNHPSNRQGRKFSSPIPRIDSFRPSQVFNPLGSNYSKWPKSSRGYGPRSCSSWCRPVYSRYIRPCYPRYNTVYYGGAYLGASWLTAPAIYGYDYYNYPYNYTTQSTIVEVPYPVYVETPPTSDAAAPQAVTPPPATSDSSSEYIEDFAGPRLPVDGAADATEARMRPYLDAGFRAMNSKLYSQAQRNFLMATFADERDGVALMLYAISSFATGDYDLAASAMRQALEITPELIEQPFDIRGLYSDDEELSAHLVALVSTVETGPTNHDLYLLLGYLHFSTGNPNHAVITLGEGATLNPSDELLTKIRDAAMYVENPQG